MTGDVSGIDKTTALGDYQRRREGGRLQPTCPQAEGILKTKTAQHPLKL
jgi:hypothetical protein